MVQALSQTNSSDYYDDDDPLFLDALADAVLPGDQPLEGDNEPGDALSEEELEPPPAAQPCLKRKRSPTPEPEDEPTVEDDIYGPASFGGFGEYMHRKRAKLQIQNDHIAKEGERSQIFKDLSIYVRTNEGTELYSTNNRLRSTVGRVRLFKNCATSLYNMGASSNPISTARPKCESQLSTVIARHD